MKILNVLLFIACIGVAAMSLRSLAQAVTAEANARIAAQSHFCQE